MPPPDSISRATDMAFSTPRSVSYVSTRNTLDSGKARAYSLNASRSLAKVSMNEWAIVPSAGIPSSAAAITLLVPKKPAMYEARAIFSAASCPCVRRAEKSITPRPSAASTTRAAFVASMDSRFTWFSMNVSASWHSITGPLTSMTGSPGKNISPSRIARTSPPNLSPPRKSRNPVSNMPSPSSASRSQSSNLRLRRYSTADSRPQNT